MDGLMGLSHGLHVLQRSLLQLLQGISLRAKGAAVQIGAPKQSRLIAAALRLQRMRRTVL